MSITVTCPTGHLLHVEDKYAGRSGRCPHCHALVHVPKPGQVSEEEILAIVEPPGATALSEQRNRQDLDPGKGRSESSSMPSHFSSPIYHHLGVSKHEDKTVVRFGDHRILDELTVKKISDELFGVAAGAKCHHLIINFTGVRGLSTLMLGKLLILRKVMAAKGGRLILCEVDPDIECVFVETKLTHIFEIMDMEADALDACK